MEATTQGQAIAVVKRYPPKKRQQQKPVLPRAEDTVRQIYRTLSQAWGAQHWWPAETPFEVIVGAILTQNTSWTNVERAMAKLRDARVLSLQGIGGLSIEELEPLVRSSGYFRQKARRLKDFVAFVNTKHSGSLEQMFATSTEELRAQLLTQKGIGMETADSILLYAGHKPVFVVDAYTRRILERHQSITAAAKYDDIRLVVEEALAAEEAAPLSRIGTTCSSLTPPVHASSAMSTAQQLPLSRVYNEMHGLIVQVGKHYCHKSVPHCESCPLGQLLSAAQRARLQSVELTDSLARSKSMPKPRTV
jgi:endonuclease-3 related protein